jgi:hypothetical protein
MVKEMATPEIPATLLVIMFFITQKLLTIRFYKTIRTHA